MTEPILQEVNSLSIWDLSHYWHGFNPQRTRPSKLPLDVQQSIRALSLKASKGLFIRCAPNSFVYRVLTDAEEQYPLSKIKRHYKREFKLAIEGKKYKKRFLGGISIGRQGLLVWCKRNNIKPPSFWFAENDPLLNKPIEELDIKLSSEDRKKMGFIPLFDEDKSAIDIEKFSSDLQQENKPNFNPKKSEIDEAISNINKANAKTRYKRADELKREFVIFYQTRPDKNKRKAAREYFNKLDLADKKALVPTYNEKQHSECLIKAQRNLAKLI